MTGREELMRQGLMGDPFTQALQSIDLRQDANNALNNASDQYEADVADFKNTQATEFEQGLASLMDRVGALENIPQPTIDTSQFLTAGDLPTIDTSQFLTAGDLPTIDTSQFLTAGDIPTIDTSQFLTAGDLPSFNVDDYRDDFLSIAREGIDIPEFEKPDLSGYARLEDLPTIDTSQFLTASDLPNFEKPDMPVFNPNDYRDDFLSIAREGIDIPEFQQPDLSNFATLDDLPTFDFDEGAFRDNLFEDILENIPQPPQTPQPPAFNEDELRESIYNDIIGDLPGLFEDFDFPIPGIPGKEPFPGDLPPMTPPEVPPFDGFPINVPGGTPGFFDQFPGIMPPGSGNPYEGIFGPGQGLPMPGILPPINFPLPPITDPITDPIIDPITPPPPVDNTPTGPINPYTGQPVKNPYKPYSTDSGAAPLNRAITPRAFGTAPGFEPKQPVPLPIDPPGGIVPPPPIMCFVAGTKIDMADGTKKVIENIAIGDEVLALNGEADVVSYVHDIPKADRNLWTINNRITATDAHAFLTKDGWKSNNSKLSNTVYNDYGIEVKDLEIGDKLITNDGVEEVTKLENEKDFVKVYNFTTSNTHTYMVDGVVSHNKLPPRPPGEGPRPIRRIREPKDMKNGGGISMLPMNGQGDTLTTQVFQAGFRPRR